MLPFYRSSNPIQEVRNTSLTCMVAHFFLWHLKMRLGGKSPSADGVATAPLVSGDPPLTHLHGSRGPRAGGVGPAVQSPGLSVAQKAS